MSPRTIGAVGVAALFAMLLLRVPVWIALTLVGFFGNVDLTGPQGALALAGTVPFDVASSYTLSVIPLFILMGEVASETGLSSDLFHAARVMLSGIRCGLAVAALAASACFGAVCGSSVATAATMTRIALPEMRKAGYDPGLATGSLAAGGSLGILIPPSIIFVIYAAIAEQSVPKLFAAGLFPGLVLTGALHRGRRRSSAIGARTTRPPGDSVSMRERLAAMREPWQFMALFLVTIGGIYAGVFSPTEAAAIGAAGAILIGVARPPADAARRCCARSRARSSPAASCSSSSSAPTCSRSSWCRPICRTCWPMARARSICPAGGHRPDRRCPTSCSAASSKASAWC